MAGQRRHRTSLSHGKKKDTDAVRSEINVAPLVDVVLVLLIIFMVVAPELMRGKEVNLPKAKNVRKQNDSGEQMIVSLVRDGGRVHYYFDQDLLANADALKARMVKEFERNGQKAVFLKADADVKILHVYPALMAIHEAGAQEVLLGTAEIKEE